MDPELETFLRRPAKQLKLHHEVALEETITCLAVVATEGGVIIAAGQSDTPAILLSDASLAPVWELAGHAGGTNTLAFAGDSRLVSAGEDGSAAVWDPRSGALLARLECEGENTDKSSKGHTVTHAACNAAGTLAACAAGRTLHVFELLADDFEAKRRVFPAVSGGVIEDVKWVGDSNRVLCAYYGGVVMHSADPESYGILLEYPTNVMAAAATPSLSYVVGGCMDSCVHIWHFQSSPDAAATARLESKEAAGAEEAAAGAASSSSSKAGQEEQQPGSSELVEYSCGGYEAKVISTVFNADSTMLATLGGTKSIMWDFTGPDGPAGSLPVVGLGHTKTVTCQAWQPGEGCPILVTGGRDGRVLVYDVTEYAEPPEDDMPIPKFAAPAAVAPNPDLQDEVTALTWSPANFRLLYAAHASGVLRCWQLELDSDDEGGAAAAQSGAAASAADAARS